MTENPTRRGPIAAFASGAAVGTLGGLIGLGGAEFRLPLLIGVFRFSGLEAVILNKAVSLVVVATALVFRSSAVPIGEVASQWPIIVNVLAGSLVGAWAGAEWATRLRVETLYRVIAVLLLIMAAMLALTHGTEEGFVISSGWIRIVLGILAGLAIGVVASLLGVAGGEFLIPTLILLFGVDVKLAGSVSLAISLPTMVAGFARYSRDRSFSVLRFNRVFLLVMAAGSVLGALIGGFLLGVVPTTVLLLLLVVLLIVSAMNIWHHT